MRIISFYVIFVSSVERDAALCLILIFVESVWGCGALLNSESEFGGSLWGAKGSTLHLYRV